MNKVVHFDVPVENPERAKEFYKKVFDWNIDAVPNMNYWMLQTTECDGDRMPTEPGAINGGMYKRDSAPVVVVDVASVDDHIKIIEEAGGKVVMPTTQVGEMGLYARVEGNIFGIWQTLKRESNDK